MTHATIRFQYDTARFELYLDKLTGLPAPNIRKLFKLMLSEPWNNRQPLMLWRLFSHTSLRKAKRLGNRHPLIFKTVGGLCRTNGAKRAVL